jgi:N4-gp56 family major capsid protein
MKFISSIVAVLAMPILLLTALFAVNVTTTAGVSSPPDYVSIPEAVRDVYSQEILFEAQPRLKFRQFAKVKTDLLAQRGKGITFTKYLNIAPGGAITEDGDLQAVGMSAQEIIINVAEYGNAIEVSELLLKTSLHDVLGDASRLLAQDFATSLDLQMRNVALTTTNAVFGGGSATAASLALGDGLDSVTIKNAVELLANNNAPKILGEYYVCIASPHQIRQLRDDSAWIDAHKYRAGDRQLFIGEAGMYEGVIFCETTQMPKWNTAQVVAKYGAGFTPAYGYEAVIFGENAFGWAVALPVELRDDGTKNYGRKHGLAWYGIWGMGIIEEKNIVKILTA